MEVRDIIHLLVILSPFLAVVTSYTCDDNPYNNGCTRPDGWSWWIKKFTKACNRHDICYACGHTLKETREKCDDAFLKAMKKSCPKKKKGVWAELTNLKRAECLAAANLYYSAVRAGGALPMYWAYEKRSWCKNSWVQECMP